MNNLFIHLNYIYIFKWAVIYNSVVAEESNLPGSSQYT